MDLRLLDILQNKISIPIIFSGGIGSYNNIIEAIPNADAIAIAGSLHYNELNILEIKKYLKKNNILIRDI